jgi:hypothetical protein
VISFKPANNCLIHTTSRAHNESATYLDSVEEQVTHGCFWVLQVIGVEYKKKRYHVVDFLSFLSPA